MKSSTNPLRNERGIAVPLVAVCLVALIGLAAVGVDTGRVATVADELQMAADVAATAGTLALADDDDATAGANAALQLNKVNGAVATAALQTIQVGNMNTSYTFTPNLAPLNAVRAQTQSVVNNILLDMIGRPQSTVTREAIATLAGIGSGIPTLPIVIGECNFNAQCYHQSCMPYLAQVPDTTNNSGWTAFFENASNTNVGHYFGSPCGGGQQQLIKVGDIIQLANGQTSPLLDRVDCLLDQGLHQFIIPIVECVGTFNQAKKVVGFAKIEVDYVVRSGSPKGIWLHGIYEGQQPGTPGGGTFGLLAVMLVK